MILFAGFGWAKPVPVHAEDLRVGPRTGMALVAAAGPLANIVMATAAAMPINLGLVGRDSLSLTFSGETGDLAGFILLSVVYWNLLLAAFNLIPLVPLDGFRVAVGILPREAAHWFAGLERYGPAPLLVLVMLGFLLPGPGLFGVVIFPMIDAMASVILP
jgi:Zn-dependent protease